MKQVLFCVDQSFLKDLIRINFRHSQFIQPIIIDNIEEAQDLFQLAQDIELIVTQTQLKGAEAAKELARTIQQNNRPCELIVLGPDPKVEVPCNVYALENVREVFEILREKFGGTEEEDLSKDNCVSMPSHLFLHFSALPFDIYLKVQQGEYSKYIKRFNASETLDHTSIEKYITRGVTDFYLERDCLKDFSKLLILQLETRLTDLNKDGEGQLLAEGEVFNSLKDMVTSLGLKPQVVKLCEMSIQNVQRRIHQDSPFKSFLESLKSSKELSFHFAFVQLTSLLCSQYVEHTDWPKKQKDDLIEKLVFSAYFCDMHLTTDEMLMARDEDHLAQFNSKQMEIINNHAQKTAEYILRYPGAPQEVDKIIMQHHGTMNGFGLSKYPWVGTLLPAQLIFYSQDLALRILQAHGKKLSQVLEEFHSHFKESPQIEIVNKFLKTFNYEASINN